LINQTNICLHLLAVGTTSGCVSTR